MKKIRSFSGTHEFHPSVLADTDAEAGDTAYEIIEAIQDGRCPRCRGLLPTRPEYPAGSRITQCRSIPICGRCGSDEAYEQMDLACGIGYGLSCASEWPLEAEIITERRERYQANAKPGIAGVTNGRLTITTEDGSTPVVNPCNTGGWAQYGSL